MSDESAEEASAPPPGRTPVFNVPLVVAMFALVLVAIHLARMALPPVSDLWIVREFGYVPGRLLAQFDLQAALSHGKPTDIAGWQRAQAAQVFIADGHLRPWTVLTYALLHTNFAHLGLNLVWFVAFGAPVARRLGAARFLALMAVTAVASAAAQTLTDPRGAEPCIGASGIVSGVMAAALRFVFQPGASLLNPGSEEGAPVPALRLGELWRDRQVVGFVAAWFVLNLVFGLFSQPLGLTDQPVAWQAHIGGFVAGLLLFPLFDPIGRSSSPGDRESGARDATG